MPTRTRAIKKFLRTVPCPIAQMYNEDMEVQVNVAKDEGTPWQKNHAFGTSRGWQNKETGEVWRPFRIPYKADTEPEYRDTQMTYDLSTRAEAIGMTGWNWKERKTYWFAYDFDSIVNHEKGISVKKMKEIENICMGVPYLGVLRSTSGQGLHIYVFFDEGVPTANHLEHSALARAFLGILSAKLGVKLDASVDCVGSVLWVWARRSENTQGLTWIKENTEKFPLSKIPKNWREHIEVVSRKKNRVTPNGKGVHSVSSAIMACELESDHKRILRWFADKAERVWWWDQDNQMLVCHSADLADCHKTLSLRGLYKTVSKGTNPEQNCFAFPLEGGKFVVRRFGHGTNEHASWQPDPKGWTKIMFNENPTFLGTMLFHGGLLNRKMEVVFPSLVEAKKALEPIGVKPLHTEAIASRQTKVKFIKKDSILCIEVVREKNDLREEGWIQNASNWEKTIPYNEEESTDALDINMDDKIRHTIMGGKEAGWFLNVGGQGWVEHSRQSIPPAIKGIRQDLKSEQITSIIGQQILNPWKRVSVPFSEEYPGNRTWNMDCAKLAYEPKRGLHPTWDALFNHVGKDLNEAVSRNKWCKENGIESGYDYLFLWCAYMFQKPNQRNPYLFLYGFQNTGKSSFHECLGTLFENEVGYEDVKNAFLSQGNFNGEMANCVLGFMDEVNLSSNKNAYIRVKDWTTALNLSIQGKGDTPYMTPNNMHFIHTSNYLSSCPVEKGDTRITLINVPPLTSEIPKDQFLRQINEEAPAILHAFLTVDLPTAFGRFGLPALETELKESLMESNASPMERFINEECVIKNGEIISFTYFKNVFKSWVQETFNQNELAKWNDARIRQEFPQYHPLVKGNSTRHNNAVHIGNLTLKDDYCEDDDHLNGLWYLDGKKLKHKTDEEMANEYN